MINSKSVKFRDGQGGIAKIPPWVLKMSKDPLDFSPKVRQKGPKFLQNGADGAILFLI